MSDEDGPKQKSEEDLKKEKREKKRPPPLAQKGGQLEGVMQVEEEGEDDEVDPADWIPMQSRTQGRPYYFHTETRETVWEVPDDYDDELPEGAAGWIEMESRTQGRYYYYNQVTRETVWERPPGVPEPPPFERRKPNPKREALRDIIQDWADEFFKKHQREPSEEDIPPGTDIARYHRDYKMLKVEESVEMLKKEQKRLREELNPESRDRLREIKKELEDIEPKVEDWQSKKQDERKRREEVTKVYNQWIKDFTEKNARGPTEKDIDAGSEIATMFKEYSKYREEAKRAKVRAARIEEGKLRLKHAQDQQKIYEYMEEFEKKHGRKPSAKDLPEGSDIAKLYKEFLERELQMNPESPNSKVEKLRREINDWSTKFEQLHERKPTRADIKAGSKIADLCAQYDSLLAMRGGKDAKAPDVVKTSAAKPAEASTASASGSNTAKPAAQTTSTASASAAAAPRPRGGDAGGDWDEMQGQSPRSYAQYQRSKQPNAGCADCCSVM